MPKSPKQIAALTHDEATRKNVPTAELQPFLDPAKDAEQFPPAAFPRARPLPEGAVRERDGDLDPQIVWNGVRIKLTPSQVKQLTETGEVEVGDAQLVWRGKDRQDWSDLVVTAPPIYVQEKIHPKALIDDLRRASARHPEPEAAPDLFADFNGVPVDARTEFYEHDAHWSNRMILGDSLQVMASLAEREALRGKVQCIYFDPPYGIKFNSNWQVSTQSRDVKDGKREDVSREPEQVKAFRDTWKDGIHSYLTYLRDRLTVARELLAESGSIFVQISDENVHRLRSLMDEVFGDENFVSQLAFQKTGGFSQSDAPSILDYALWYARDASRLKARRIYLSLPDPDPDDPNYTLVELPDISWRRMTPDERRGQVALPPGSRVFRFGPLISEGRSKTPQAIEFEGSIFHPKLNGHWKTNSAGMGRLSRAGKLLRAGNNLAHRLYWDSFPAERLANVWLDTQSGGFNEAKVYVVQTTNKVVERCILMSTDPGDLVLDPTCGSGTTATVAEQWGRRWITIDTSRVALALARTRLMSARYPYYLLADSPEGRRKEQEVSGKAQPLASSTGDIRQGFVYERAPHVTLKSIANNAEIDIIYDRWQETLEPLRAELNRLLGKSFEDWEIPREAGADWPAAAKAAHQQWWEGRIARQKEIDASIARAADVEFLYDRPYADPGRVRVAGPFTVESLSPHRGVPEADIGEEIEAFEGRRKPGSAPATDFAAMVLENLRAAGVQGRDRQDRVRFTALQPWPGKWIGGEGRYLEGPETAQVERRAAIFIGPEFGTLSRPDLVAAAREAADCRFDLLVACAFSYDAHASELTRLGPLPILQAKMNPDLHMADDLKTTGKGNLFVVFGEPDIDIERLGGDLLQVRVKGVDVFDPNTGEVRSNDTKGIAAWFIDTDYDEESFFVRHAYFLGAGDPYKSLRTALQAEIDADAWGTLYRDTSRPFARPETGRIAVKVINHFGDEVMKVFEV